MHITLSVAIFYCLRQGLRIVVIHHVTRASASGLCRAKRRGFDTRSARDFLSVPFTVHCISSLFNLGIGSPPGTLADGDDYKKKKKVSYLE